MSVYHTKWFETKAERDAYSDGLLNGADFNCQGHGTDPYQVIHRTKLDSNKPYGALLQRGSYRDCKEVFDELKEKDDGAIS